MAHLREAVRLIRALLGGDDAGLASELFSLQASTRLRYPLPPTMPRVLLGTWGQQTAALAGAIADEVKVGGSANPAMVAVMRERIAVGLHRAGRGEGEVSVVVGAVTVVDEDGAAARARARTEIAMYLAVVAVLDPTVTLPADLLARLQERLAAGDDEGAGRLVPDDVLDLFAFAGTPEHVAARAQAVLDAGAARVEFGTPHGLSNRSGVDLLGRRMLPLLTRG